MVALEEPALATRRSSSLTDRQWGTGGFEGGKARQSHEAVVTATAESAEGWLPFDVTPSGGEDCHVAEDPPRDFDCDTPERMRVCSCTHKGRRALKSRQEQECEPRHESDHHDCRIYTHRHSCASGADETDRRHRRKLIKSAPQRRAQQSAASRQGGVLPLCC